MPPEIAKKIMAQTTLSLASYTNKKRPESRSMINTLLHMKLQPKLRMTSQDWDFTKDKLDMSLL